MIIIPRIGAFVSAAEAAEVSDALEMGANALMQFVTEQRELLGMIASQATSLQTLMTLQTAITDTIVQADEDGLTISELRERLEAKMSEFAA